MTIENELHHPTRRPYMYIYTIKTKKKLILFILRGNFLRIFRKNWWYPCKIERKMDGETHEGSRINLNYFFLLLMYKKLVLILNHWILLLIAKEQPALSIWPTVGWWASCIRHDKCEEWGGTLIITMGHTSWMWVESNQLHSGPDW